MPWHEMFGADHPPTLEEMDSYIASPLWRTLNHRLCADYKVSPQMAYSSCSLQPGWNLKYRKGGRALCTLYPMEGSFIALVVVGKKEEPRVQLSLPLFGGYTRSLIEKTPFSAGGRWLMLTVADPSVLDDVLELIAIRATSK